MQSGFQVNFNLENNDGRDITKYFARRVSFTFNYLLPTKGKT